MLTLVVIRSLSDTCADDLPSKRVDAEKIKHLSTQQCEQLLQLLDEFAVC